MNGAVSGNSSIRLQSVKEGARSRVSEKRNLLHLPFNDSRGILKRRPWNRSPSRSSTTSNLSVSEEELHGWKRPSIKIVTTKDEEIGPVARRTNGLLEVQNGPISSKSPISPDHWDKQRQGRPISQKMDVNLDFSTTGDSASPRDDHRWPASRFLDFSRKSKSEAREDADGQARYSMDTLDSTAPNSPNTGNFMPGISRDLSSPAHRHRMPGIPFLRHEYEKAKHQIDSNDFAVSNTTIDPSRLSVNEARRPHRSSLGKVRPGLTHKRSCTVDDISSLKDEDATSGKDFPSNLSRFFKGGRIGELVRSEGSASSRNKRQSIPLSEDAELSERTSGSVRDKLTDDERRLPQGVNKPQLS